MPVVNIVNIFDTQHIRQMKTSEIKKNTENGVALILIEERNIESSLSTPVVEKAAAWLTQ